MRIKEVAARLNLSARTIRFYEEKGLIRPGKEPDNQYRQFTERDIRKLQTIVALRESGMTVEEIRVALNGLEEFGSDELLNRLEQQRSLMLARWIEMKRTLETTDRMIALLQAESGERRERLFELAGQSRVRREQKRKWKDVWQFDRLAATHDERVTRGAGPYEDYEETLLAIVGLVDPAVGENGLDIGTGTGNLAGRLLERGAYMSGLDQSREMLAVCRSKFPQMETRLGNFLALPYPDHEFDFIVSSFVFHHLTEEQQPIALDELRRTVKPGGRVCIADLMTLPSENNCSAGRSTAGHLPSVERLLGWLQAAGFTVRRRQIRPTLHVVLGQASVSPSI